MPRTRKRRPRREVVKAARSDASLPEFDRGAVPPGLVTRRALRAMNLSPGGNRGPAAILRCKLCATRPHWSCRHPTRGYLLRVDLAVSKRVPTLAQERALDQAMAARQTCGDCGRRFFFCLSKNLGCCLECYDGTPADPSTYLPPPPGQAPPGRMTTERTTTMTTVFSEPDRPKNLQIRYLNLVGASLDVTGSGEHAQDNRWTCRGCKDTSSSPETDWLWRIRKTASGHASTCRAIQLT
ncbi:RRQRL motif-containing zinc-binding protein [Streptomyces xanthochromogenes]|uniref:RRQRL motif-containing zinc-binding protein n=1 Tax=Streptomyces xanthochromogenes TaxID=67384 RepID=UPI00344884FC